MGFRGRQELHWWKQICREECGSASCWGRQPRVNEGSFVCPPYQRCVRIFWKGRIRLPTIYSQTGEFAPAVRRRFPGAHGRIQWGAFPGEHTRLWRFHTNGNVRAGGHPRAGNPPRDLDRTGQRCPYHESAGLGQLPPFSSLHLDSLSLVAPVRLGYSAIKWPHPPLTDAVLLPTPADSPQEVGEGVGVRVPVKMAIVLLPGAVGVEPIVWEEAIAVPSLVP